MDMAMYKPQNLNLDELSKHLKSSIENGAGCVINLENVTSEDEAQRILDVVTGICFYSSAEINTTGSKVYKITPTK